MICAHLGTALFLVPSHPDRVQACYNVNRKEETLVGNASGIRGGTSGWPLPPGLRLSTAHCLSMVLTTLPHPRQGRRNRSPRERREVWAPARVQSDSLGKEVLSLSASHETSPQLCTGCAPLGLSTEQCSQLIPQECGQAQSLVRPKDI